MLAQSNASSASSERTRKITTFKRQEGARKCRQHGGSNKDRRATTSNNKLSTLRNTFNGKVAAGDQHQDLVTFHDVGQKEYERYVTHTFIQDPSSKLITHQHKLKTFSAQKMTKTV